MQNYQKVCAPFQINADDVERSSLDDDDIGKWALLVTGCHHLFDSKNQAHSVYKLLLRDIAVR